MFEHEKNKKSIMKAKRCEEKQLSMPSQGVVMVETLKPSMSEEFPKVNELPQARIKVERVILHETKLYSSALILYRISLKHLCTLTSMLVRNHTMELED
ncbi:hypothetical protein M9H77_36473 [Catharanthus roseus]|uniref:Uncharacterized protein n=1 Tax=Catharanthus roseus TaxID=4058 RepID=A0ACB9ZTV2_CATRO|nr:hypothetical protein M9H77_36473 [Catharanthus roseus]